MNRNDDEYKSLAFAIVEFAVKEYVEWHIKKVKTTYPAMIQTIDWNIKKLEEFFRSDWCLLLLPEGFESTEGFLYELKKRVEKEVEKSRVKAKYKPDEKTIVRLYVEELKSAQQIAELCGIADQTVRNKLHKAGIELRGKECPSDILTKEVLEDLYWNKEKTSRDIGLMYGFSEFTILAKMKKYGIPTRKKGKRKLY